MQKFEELERIQKQGTSVGGNGQTGSESASDPSKSTYLDDEQQEELFKKTLQSNVYSEIMYEREKVLSDDDEQEPTYSSDEDYVDGSNNDGMGYYSEDEELNFENLCVVDGSEGEDLVEENFDEDTDDGKRSKKKRKAVTKRSNGKGVKNEGNLNDLIITDPNFNFLVESNTKSKEKKSSVEVLQIPPTEKLNWAKIIQPLTENECSVKSVRTEFVIDMSQSSDDVRVYKKQVSNGVGGKVFMLNTQEDVIITDNLIEYDFESLGSEPFEGILIDPPYERMDVQDLKKLPLDEEWFMKRGYCFIWIDKKYMVDVIKIMREFEFEYVDSMVWVKENLDQTFTKNTSHLLPISKLTLVIFRKMNELTKSMSIMHQRNPDTVMDFDKSVDNPKFRPPVVFQMIETLLYSSNRLLELWGDGSYLNCKQKTQSKWTTVKEVPNHR